MESIARPIFFPLPVLLGFIMTVSVFTTNAQDIQSIQQEDILEKISERASEEINPEEITNESSPGSMINLNSASAGALLQTGLLTPLQVEKILAYIRDYGEILSLNELHGIEGLDSSAIAKLEPVAMVGSQNKGPKITLHNLIRYGRHDLVLRYDQVLQQKEGYLNAAYQGSPVRYYFRYNFKFSDKVLIGLGGEKDAGEQFFTGGQQYGFDFYTGYLALQNISVIRTLVAGNFSASFGQGLCLGSGTSMSSVAGSGAPFRITQGIRPSGSMNENQYFRGIGITIKLWKFDVSAFLSTHRRDASVAMEDTSEQHPLVINSLQYTGYHRTSNEIAGKNAVRERAWGGNISFTGQYYRIGITMLNSSWDSPFKPGNDLYRYYSFSGKSNLNLSFDFVARLKFLTLFGEGSISKSGGKGVIAGIFGEVAQGTTFSFTYRNYSPRYQDNFANPVSQNSQASNEKGYLVNISAQVARNISLSAYADLFSFPWIKYRVNSSSSGAEAGVTAVWQLTSKIIQTGRFSYRTGMLNNTRETVAIYPVEEISSWGLRYRIDWMVSPGFRLRTFFDLKHSGKGATNGNTAGYMAGEDFHFVLNKPRLAIDLRYILFDIPDYNLRIYSYEPEVAFAYSAPAYEGEGIRFIVNLLVSPYRFCDIEGRFAVTWFNDRQVIGTGNEAIDGQVKSDLKLQLRFRL